VVVVVVVVEDPFVVDDGAKADTAGIASAVVRRVI
jgi:hypothetical protein